MTYQPIGTANAVLYFSSEDLNERGINAVDFTPEELLQLVRDTFFQAGDPVPQPLEIETYPSEAGLLIFVYAAPLSQTVWCFDDFEALITACTVLQPCDADGPLYRWEGQYWLLLQEPDARAKALLSEFSQQAKDVYICSQLAEYGTLLLPERAQSVLREYF